MKKENKALGIRRGAKAGTFNDEAGKSSVCAQPRGRNWSKNQEYSCFLSLQSISGQTGL